MKRWDPERKPTIGGISLYIVFLFCVSVTYGPYFNGENEEQLWLLGLLGAASLAFLMGLSDDVSETRPYLKLFVQLVCGSILVASGTSFQVPGHELLGHALTVLWVILLMNSFNMIDNMDGVAGGIALTLLSASLFHCWMLEGAGSFLPILSGMIAAVLGFLPFNLYPSKIFMGDAGTQFLGLILAFIGIRYFWNTGLMEAPSPLLLLEKGVFLLLLFWTSLTDTITVFILRMKRGDSPLKGGKDHTTHSWSYAGWSDRGVNLLFFLWSLLNVLLALLVMNLSMQPVYRIIIFLAYMIITFVVMFLTAYRSGEKRVFS